MRIAWIARISILGVIALVAVSCSNGDEGGVDATLADFSIVLASPSAPSGSVTFNVTNDASQVHEFVVFRTDLGEDALPTDENGDVDEEGSTQLTLVDEIEDIQGGAQPSLTVDLEPGHYVVVCNLPGHYRQGMYASFTVS